MIDTATLRTLASQNEGTRLDFKLVHHDNNKELAKDLMAMANCLSPDQAAFILVGIDETQDYPDNLVGVVAGSDLDDAIWHQRVATYLNRTPDFAYNALEHDGKLFGVFEISSGGRPFFPIRDSADVLRRNVAVVRDGTSTAAASPDAIIEWWQQDNAHAVERAALELERLREELAIRPRLQKIGASRGPNGFTIKFRLHNDGSRTLTVETATVEALAAEGLKAAYMSEHSVPAPTSALLSTTLDHLKGTVLRSKETREFSYAYQSSGLNEHLAQLGGRPLAGFQSDWLDVRVTIECRAGDRLETLIHSDTAA